MSASDRIARLDEMLELLFWLEGEGFAGNATRPSMARFLTWSETELDSVLGALVERGDVVAREDGSGEYTLTEVGRREAGRRFLEEFSPMLAQGHGECSDPECECRTSADGPAACRTRH